MKRVRNSGKTVKISFLIALTLMTFTLVIISSCGKTGSSDPAVNVKDTKSAAADAPDKDIPFVQVDEMPMYEGGIKALLDYIATNSIYPEEAKKNNISGKVIVRFIVGKDCTISGVEVLKSDNSLLDAEAVRVVSSLPKFEKPARNNGKVVSVFYMVPITFALK